MRHTIQVPSSRHLLASVAESATDDKKISIGCGGESSSYALNIQIADVDESSTTNAPLSTQIAATDSLDEYSTTKNNRGVLANCKKVTKNMTFPRKPKLKPALPTNLIMQNRKILLPRKKTISNADIPTPNDDDEIV